MNQVLISLFTFLLGYLLGHWLAIGRDKRKEFNAAVAPIREWLLRVSKVPHPAQKRPSHAELDAYSCRLGRLQRKRFNSLLEAYDNSVHRLTQQDKDTGEIELSDMLEPRGIALDLLKLAKVR